MKEPITYKVDDKEYRIHELKTVEPYYSDVVKGDKTFEVRKFDRDFKIGDFLSLRKYYPSKDKYTGEEQLRRITYMLTDKPFVPEGYVILGMVKDKPIIEH